MRILLKPSVIAILVMAAALSLWKLTASTAHQAEEARGILMEAAAALGGLEALQALRSQVVVSRGSSFEPKQAVRPGGEPRHVADFEYTLTRDIAGEKLRIAWKRESFYPFSHTWKFTELAGGVYHVVGGTHHSMVVEMKDHLVVVEAPLNEEPSRAVIAGIRERWPARPIRIVVNTHFHNDHSGGLRTYVAEGARVITTAVNEAHLRRVFAAPHTLVPDALERNCRRAEIEAITEPKTLTDGQQRVEVYPVECSHVEGMLMVYLPQEKILFQSDLFVAGSPQPLQAGARELLRAIQQRHLKVEQLAGGHGPVGSFEELRKAAGELM